MQNSAVILAYRPNLPQFITRVRKRREILQKAFCQKFENSRGQSMPVSWSQDYLSKVCRNTRHRETGLNFPSNILPWNKSSPKLCAWGSPKKTYWTLITLSLPRLSKFSVWMFYSLLNLFLPLFHCVRVFKLILSLFKVLLQTKQRRWACPLYCGHTSILGTPSHLLENRST